MLSGISLTTTMHHYLFSTTKLYTHLLELGALSEQLPISFGGLSSYPAAQWVATVAATLRADFRQTMLPLKPCAVNQKNQIKRSKDFSSQPVS